MSTQSDSPETRPCPECGGPRVAHDVRPEIVALSTAAARGWEKMRREGEFKLVRCTNCGYSAFFYVKREPMTQDAPQEVLSLAGDAITQQHMQEQQQRLAKEAAREQKRQQKKGLFWRLRTFDDLDEEPGGHPGKGA